MENWWTNVQSEKEAWIRAARKIRKGGSADESDICLRMVSRFGKISGRYSANTRIEISRLPYAPSPARIDLFQCGYFRQNAWKELRELKEEQPELQAIWKHEKPYVSATGYWFSHAEIAFDMMDETASSANTEGIEQTTLHKHLGYWGAWARLPVEYAFQVHAIRMQFNRKATRDPFSAKPNQEIYEGVHELPANEMLDERVKRLEGLREAQLAKAFANLAASNAVEKNDRGGVSE